MKGGLTEIKGSERIRGWGSDTCTEFWQMCRHWDGEEGQKPFRPEKLPASKPKAGSCWLCFKNSKEDSVAGSENGEGTQEEDGLGILFWVQWESEKDYKQSRGNDHICIKNTIFMHLARRCAWCLGQSSEPRWITISSRKRGGGGEERQAYRPEDKLMMQQLGWKKWMDSKYSLRWNWYNLMMDWEWRVRRGPSGMKLSFLFWLVRVSDFWVPHPFLLCPETSSSICCFLFKYLPQKSMMISYTLR